MRRALAILSLLALFTACNGDGTSPGSAGIAGTYTLRTVNGAPLPFVVTQAGTYKNEITDDAFVLTDGGAWTEVWHDRTTSNGAVTTQEHADAGTYARAGTAITLTSPGKGAISGSVSGGTLSLSAQGIALVYMQ